MKKGITKPRNMPYPASGLSCHNGVVAIVVDMRAPKQPFTLPLAKVPACSKAVFSQLKHERCGDAAWMRSINDVNAAFFDRYSAGELDGGRAKAAAP